MRIKTVGDLKEMLEKYDDETRILAVHQPSWPLQEEINRVWLDDGTPDEDDGCFKCDHIWDIHGPNGCNGTNRGEPCECSEERGSKADHENVVYIVVNGHPYDLSPYGPKEAFSEY